MVKGPNFSTELPRTRECARLAREFLADSIPTSPALETLDLIASELVTNAFKHGSGGIRLSLEELSASHLRLQVSSSYDVSTGAPDLDALMVAETLAERGRGLQIVNALSSEWGWEIAGPTLLVWADVDV